MRRRWLLLGALAAASAAGAWWLLRPSTTRARLVILYAPCTVNRAFLSPYNPAVPYTPFLQQFARASVVFGKHQTEEGSSGIAYAALLSGTQAMGHGIYVNTTRLDDSVYLMAEAFRDAGYETFFWANHPMASPELNYAQGVDPAHVYWSKVPSIPPRQEYFLRADDPRFVEILDRLAADPSDRAFIFTAFTITHVPYWANNVADFCAAYPGECRGIGADEVDRYARLFWSSFMDWQFAFAATAARHHLSPAEIERFAEVMTLLYKSNIFHLDRRFGAVVEEVKRRGLFDASIIVFTADHGEIVERTNASMRWSHGMTLAAEDVVIPLMLHAPGLAAGRYDGVTRSIDVLPTMAGLAGIALPPNTAIGAELAPVLAARRPPPRLLAFSHSALLPPGFNYERYSALTTPFPRPDPAVMWVAVRDGNRVYKFSSPDGESFAPHVYDWESDPTERADLYDPSDPEQAQLLKRLAEYKGELIEGYGAWRAVTEGRVPSERQQELLRSLGYIK